MEEHKEKDESDHDLGNTEEQEMPKDMVEEKPENSEKKVKVCELSKTRLSTRFCFYCFFQPVVPKRQDSVKKTAELAKMAIPVRPAQ